jgi:hypothetical protein
MHLRDKQNEASENYGKNEGVQMSEEGMNI